MGTRYEHIVQDLWAVRAAVKEAAGWMHVRKEPRIRNLHSAVTRLTEVVGLLVEDLYEYEEPDEDNSPNRRGSASRDAAR